jgi:hypothetical protein
MPFTVVVWPAFRFCPKGIDDGQGTGCPAALRAAPNNTITNGTIVQIRVM